MQVTVEEEHPGTVELTVLVESDQYGKAIDEVLDQIARSTQIPGFRKGKAPRRMVERASNPEAVRARAIDRVLPEAYQKALDQAGVRPLYEPQVQLIPTENDRELQFKITVHKIPEVEIGSIEGLQLTQYVTQITDEDVEREMRNALETHQQFEEIADGVIEAGDIAAVDVDIHIPSVEGSGETEESQDLKLPGLSLKVGDYQHSPAVDDDLMGMKIGEEKDIPVSYPPDYYQPDFRGVQATWHVTVTAIRRVRPVELTDEGVKTAVGVETVEEFRRSIRQQLEDRARQLDAFSLKEQAMVKLLEMARVVYPHVLVEEEIQARLENLQRELKRNHVTLESFAAQQGGTVDQYMEYVHETAEEGLRSHFVINFLASREEIGVTDEEVDAEIEREGLEKGTRPAIIELQKKNEKRRAAVQFGLLRERVLEKAISAAQVTTENQTFETALQEEVTDFEPFQE